MPFDFYMDPYKGEVTNPFNTAIVAAIALACRTAWLKIPAFDYKDSLPFEARHYFDERELNKRMAEILNYILDHENLEWFSSSEFQVVSRDARQVGANLDDDEQSPDLTFRLTNYPPGITREGCALYVECKVLDHTADRNVTYYVKTGVARFVDGKYAHRMPIGMLLAYVNASQVLPGHLTDCFEGSRASDVKRLRPVSGVSAYSSIASPPDVYITEHARPLVPQCGSLRLLHLWLAPPTTIELR